MNILNTPIYKGMEWITRFLFIHLLWILFTLLGGIVLGLFPATITSHAIMRKWLRGETDFSVFQTFWSYYKQEFWKSNQLGVFVILFLGLVVLDFYYIFIKTNSLFVLEPFTIPLYIFILFVSFFLLYVFPVAAHYEWNVRQIIKNTFLIILVSPFHTLIMIIVFVSLYFIYKLVPALFFLFGSSIFAFVTTWISLDRFNRFKRKNAAH
jgi:uncharacterized membrane protein YesL